MEVMIVGAGLSGLSAAITLAGQGIACHLISAQASERAQSVMAAGGINGALNTMGEDDCTENHYNDTCKAGVYIGDPEAIRGLTTHAPEIIRYLASLGVPFNQKDGEIAQRNFGGQKKKRTAYARSSTGKIIMSALIDEARRFESAGLITRYPHHEFVRLLIAETESRHEVVRAGDAAIHVEDELVSTTGDVTHVEDASTNQARLAGGDSHGPAGRRCCGVSVRDVYTGEISEHYGPVILASGGINGMFPGMTTGTTTNSGEVTATVFAQGVRLGNLEMIQYHPTTIGIAGKRCLISEAARGEGGRLYVERGGERWYFMEERYPELGNLMPRDVVAREMYFVCKDPACGDQVYLDMTHLAPEIWQRRLPDLREEVRHYMAIDPATTPIPLEPGIHYFMGGIDVDVHHRTNLPGLYAAGECCCQYHGANRLGGNSMLGAIYGGRVAAEDLIANPDETDCKGLFAQSLAASGCTCGNGNGGAVDQDMSMRIGDVNGAAIIHAKDCNCEHDGAAAASDAPASPVMIRELSERLLKALGISRIEEELVSAIDDVTAWIPRAANERERNRLRLGLAMLQAAEMRRESRGAHYRSDYPERNPEYQRQTYSECVDGEVRTSFGPLVEEA